MHHAPRPHSPVTAGDAPCANLASAMALPAWLPDAVRFYLNHTEAGQSLRALARRSGLHASTVLRSVRRCEQRRDDPLVDEALAGFHRGLYPPKSEDTMQHSPIAPKSAVTLDEVTLSQQAPRLLRRLAEAGAFLAIAPNMDKAAVMRALPNGRLMRIAVVDRALAQVFALKEWIALRNTAKKISGKIDTYDLTSAGRAELKARLADSAREMQEAAAPFMGMAADSWQAGTAPRRVRYNLAESPVAVLGRRRKKDGQPYLCADMLRAAERLREDFELAQMGAQVTQNWEGFLTAGVRSRGQGGLGAAAPRDARARVAAALADLGPDLGHIALRVCCHLEGVEEAEQRMGWAARSGKVVLRIALRRLWRHYDETYGPSGPLMG